MHPACKRGAEKTKQNKTLAVNNLYTSFAEIGAKLPK